MNKGQNHSPVVKRGVSAIKEGCLYVKSRVLM